MSPAEPRFDEEETAGHGHGWPQPQGTRQPARWSPPPRRRGSSRDVTTLALAGLGLALAAACAGWYLSLNRSSPPSRLAVPRVVGQREHAAVARLTTLGFGVRAVEEPGTAPAGIVFSQRPRARTILARGATVTIDVANGEKP
jgi:hypothetical protein